MAHTKATTILTLKKELRNPQGLYQSDCVKWKGRTKDTHEYYSEIIAKQLLSVRILNIDIIAREQSYVPQRISGARNKSSNRIEERFAHALVARKLCSLGTILNYQVPVKGKRSDKAGKIDLISSQWNAVYLIELKGPLNGDDTLLRSVLEIWTYLKQVDTEKLLADLEQEGKRLKAALLLFPGTLAAEEAKRLKEMPNLRKLIKLLKVKIFIFDSNEVII